MEIKFKGNEVETVIEKVVKNGQILGLTKYEGRKVKVIILVEPIEEKAPYF